MHIVLVIVLSFMNLPVFAGEMNKLAHEECLRGETIAKDNKNNPEFVAYKKAAKQSIHDYEHFMKSLKEQHIQNIRNTKLGNSIKPAPKAIVFVSFGMPDLSLKQVIYDAARYQIPVVIRGLIDNSFKKTAARVFALVKEKNKGGISINPNWFKQYSINIVPACVVKEGDKFDVIYGNIRIKNMLEIIAANGTTKDVVQSILDKEKIKV